MVKTQIKNQNIFWLWSDEIDLVKRSDAYYWLPKFLDIENTTKTGVKLQELLIKNITYGHTPLGGKNTYTKKGILFIRSGQLNDFFLDLTDNVYISESVHRCMQRSMIKSRDVLVATVGATIGAVAIVPEIVQEANCNQAVGILRVDEKRLNPYYLAIYLTLPYGKEQILRQSSGGARDNLDPFELKQIKIVLPKIQDQQKVEQIVKEAFQLKKEAEKERQEADLILENSIKEFFTTDEPKAFWRWNTDIEIDKTLEPNFWKKTISSKKYPTIEFGDIFNYQKGTEVGSALYQDSGIPFLRVSDLGDLEIQFGNSSKYINETLFNELKNEFQPHKGELLFSKDATIGLMAKVETEEKQIISSGILRLQIKNKDFDPDFLMAFLTNKFINQEFVKNSTGSVIKHLNTQKLSKIELPLIDKQIQKEVANKIKSSISKKQFSRQKLQEAKDFVETLVRKSIK
ncbi:MAG: restriction endonuclease subunit S [Candidatus Pacebacteria bacterium]|nr:restriction endonuclease subunit S [Candidatus Paceibacterota bacterium]